MLIAFGNKHLKNMKLSSIGRNLEINIRLNSSGRNFGEIRIPGESTAVDNFAPLLSAATSHPNLEFSQNQI